MNFMRLLQRITLPFTWILHQIIYQIMIVRHISTMNANDIEKPCTLFVSIVFYEFKSGV